MLPLPTPEPLALLQAAAEDSVTAGLASLPQDLRGQNSRHVVMLRGRRRVFLLDNGKLRNAFSLAIGMPGWETPTGTFEVLQKIPNPVWVHPVSGERVEEQGPTTPWAATGSLSIAIASAVMPTTAMPGSRSRDAPPRGFMAPPTAGRWDGPSPMAACGFTTRMCVPCIARCRLELR